MNQDLLNEAMILYEQEQRQEHKQQQSTPDCLHDGQKGCSIIHPSPLSNSHTRLFILYT